MTTDLSNIEITTNNNIHYITKGDKSYWFATGEGRLHEIVKYGTSEGVKLAWESRDRGNSDTSISGS